jgi:alkyl hydroperoxide reductase subunit D
MNEINALREKFPETAKDVKLNLSSIFTSDALSEAQCFGVALCSAMYLGCEPLRDALHEDASEAGVGEAMIEDAKAAAALMGMNTVYYRTRHMLKSEAYDNKQARLRMTRMAKPATDKGTFELMSMAIAALAGCEMCINAHEKSILEHGMTDEHVHEAVRIGAVINSAAIAVSLS